LERVLCKLHSFPKVVNRNFKSAYDGIQWRNDEADFKRWCSGNTGYPMMQECASSMKPATCTIEFVWWLLVLCKHLLIEWQWGEAYFAELLD
jgi:deoxyribodipyrimidine photo-lyase